jgi:predicted PurR-regulated permease PerM
MYHQLHPNKVRQFLFLGFLLFLGIVIVKELSFLLLPILGAATLYVFLKNYMVKLVVNHKWKKGVAATILLIASLLLIVIPMVALISFGVNKAMPFIQNPDELQTKFVAINAYVQNKTGYDFATSGYLQKISGVLLGLGQKAIGGTLNTISIIALTYFILYFLLYQMMDVELNMRKYLPFKSKNANTLIKKTRDLIYSNAIGIPIVAIAQGIVAVIGYAIFGAHEFLLLGLLTALASVVPIVGTMLVYIPLGLYMLSQGQTYQGIGVIVWGFVIIGGIDNVVRFLVAKKLANVHPLTTIFGVIMGVNLFGFLGIIFGPILLSIFVVLIEIYINEYGIADADEVDAGMD